MEFLSPVTTAIIPVIIFFALGCFLRNANFLPREGWAAVEKIVYYLALPAFIIHMMTQHKITFQVFLDTGIAFSVTLLAMFLFSFLAWFHRGMTGERFAAIASANVSVNTYVAIAMANSFLGGVSGVLSAVAIGALLPISNMIGICALLIWGKPTSDNEGALSNIIANPMIIACGIGGFLIYMQIPLPATANEILNLLGATALPLGLMAAGAALEFGLVKDTSFERLLWSGLRLVLLPVIAVFTCKLFGIQDKSVLRTVAIIGTAPIATTSYVLAKKLGGDGAFSASLIASSTLLSFITAPLVLIFLLNYVI